MKSHKLSKRPKCKFSVGDIVEFPVEFWNEKDWNSTNPADWPVGTQVEAKFNGSHLWYGAVIQNPPEEDVKFGYHYLEWNNYTVARDSGDNQYVKYSDIRKAVAILVNDFGLTC